MKLAKKKIANLELTNAIHAENRRRGWTLVDLAAHLGISHIYMASLSRGARQIGTLDVDKQRILAAYLGMSLVDLLMACGALREEDFLIASPIPQSGCQDGQSGMGA